MRNYLDLLRKILDEGEDVQSGAMLVSENRKPTCRFLLGQQLRFDLREGFPAVTTKQLRFDWVVDELLWFLRGETNVTTLGRKVGKAFILRPIWSQWADPMGDVGPIYGHAWRRWDYPVLAFDSEGLEDIPMVREAHWDQVARLVEDLRAVKSDPSNRARRRIILTAWNPPMVPRMGLPPCHILSQWLPTNGYLDCVVYWRSIDMFTGCPFNIAQYALLTHFLARVSGFYPRHLVCNIADCHLYDNQFTQVEDQCARTPFGTPFLAIDDRFFEIAPDLTVEQLRQVDPAWISLKSYLFHKERPGGRLPEIAV